MDKPIATQYVSTPVCPKCGTKEHDWWEHRFQGDGDEVEYDCDCGCKYKAMMHITTEFCSKEVTE